MSNKFVQNILYFLIGISIFYFIRYFYFKPSVKVAQQVPGIESSLADGSPFILSSLKGKYVLVDFWGSWCVPCRKEAPDLKLFYSKWNQVQFSDGLGLDILSIAIEDSKEDWLRAKTADGMDWPLHILELDKFNSKLVKTFGVKEIPTKILIGPDQTILAVNQSFEMMSQMLEKRKI